MKSEKYSYVWQNTTAKFTKDKGIVFSCFAGGGGSTMGYKLSGFDVIGCNEIDSKMMETYITNHKPKYTFRESIQTFKKQQNLPKELYNLDILDGSPPCSSFSLTGNREKDWGCKKKFREGQAYQKLDTLFFDFIDLAKELQPKVVIAENVKGLLQGNAIKYVIKIYKEFNAAGYYVQHWLLNAANMGVPQRRERVFFIALRKDLAKPFLYTKGLFIITPKLILKFNEKKIVFKEICDHSDKKNNLTNLYLEYWNNAKQGESVGRFKTRKKLIMNCIPITILANNRNFHPIYKRYLNNLEICKMQSFPIDYNFGENDCNYICGMSVPPIMTAKITDAIYHQWLQ